MIALTRLLSCAEELPTSRPARPVLLDEPAPEAPFADCPPFDFLLRLQTGGESLLTRVVPLADGDVVVGGRHVGGEQFGRGEGDLLSWETGGFVARLSPEGRLRWSRDIQGGVDDLVVVGDGVWVTGAYVTTLVFDGVSYPVDGPGGYAVRVGGDGAVERVLTMGGVQGRFSVAEDPAGNVYLAAGLHEAYLTVGDLQISRFDVTEQNDQDAWVGSFDAAGRLRWLTAVGGPIWSYTTGLFWNGEAVQWVVSHKNDPGALTATYGTGGGVRVPLGVQSRTTSLLQVDPATGHVSDTPGFYFSGEALALRVKPTDAGITLIGTLYTPTSWVDSTGASQHLDGPPRGGAWGTVLTLSGTGAPSHVRLPTTASAETGAVRGTEVAVAGTQQFTHEFGAGTDRAVTFGSGVLESDGWFGLFDEQDQFRCGWEVKGRNTQTMADVTWAADGSLWVVGRSEEPYIVVDALGRELTRSEPTNTEGFAIRFHPPGE